MNAADEMKKMRDGRTGVKKLVHRKKKESRVEKKSMKRVRQKKERIDA